YLCGKDKGYKNIESHNRPCRSCNGKKANKESLKVRQKPKQKCSIEGCDEHMLFKTMCAKHYEKHRKPKNKPRTNCLNCNVELTVKRGNTKYCSKACNSSAWRKRHPNYRKEMLKTNINARLAANLRNRIRNCIKGKIKVSSAIKDLGCSIEELKKHLQSKFSDGMNWHNYGKWHLDHVRPLSSYDLTNIDEFKEACHFSNLQPLWEIDNKKKSSNYNEQ
ncbi:hypothetical protein EBR43_08770, partial [bacterium]|nr:hypothetical protein [bacterium]